MKKIKQKMELIKISEKVKRSLNKRISKFKKEFGFKISYSKYIAYLLRLKK